MSRTHLHNLPRLPGFLLVAVALPGLATAPAAAAELFSISGIGNPPAPLSDSQPITSTGPDAPSPWHWDLTASRGLLEALR